MSELSNNNPVLLTLREMACVTAGQWRNLPESGLEITGVNFFMPRVIKGDLFVCREKRLSSAEEIEATVQRAFRHGAVAAVVVVNSIKSKTYPALEVADTEKALQDLAMASSLKFDGTRILVTGSHGKTGFKTLLYHLIRKQIPTHAHLDSANKEAPVWRTLAAIPKGAQVAIVEVAVPAQHFGEDRSLFIRPDYCVITGIGPEHLSTHKTLENLIRNKAGVAVGLRSGGKCILNADDVDFPALHNAIRERTAAEIMIFGSSRDCHGRLLEAHFADFRWRVRAEILGEPIEYDLPLLENYSPLASVSVLLMAKLLGANLALCTAELASYQNFDSSGNLYRVNTAHGHFLVYDQTQRGELKGFESMFELMSRMSPAPGGRKIAVISEFINLKDNRGVTPDLDKMRVLMTQAGIDVLHTVKDFKVHSAALPDNVEWRHHGDDFESIQHALLDMVRENDMIFLRGVLSANLGRMVKALLNKGCGAPACQKIY